MASNASNIDDLLQCSICLEIFHDPKVLDCQHTFCANCLKVHLSRLANQTNSIDCPLCRRRTQLLNHSIDSLPGNYIVRDIIERQYGQNLPARSPAYTQQIEDRLKKLRQLDDEKEKNEEETDLMEYIKPAAAALVGVLGGLLLAKGVKTLCDKSKKSDGN